MDWHRLILVFLVILLTQCSNHMIRCVITDVRLVGGPTSNKGTVEIRQNNGSWETTCGINLGINDVIVICRQLGFTGAGRAIANTPYAQNSDPTKGLQCNRDISDEADLSGCMLSLSSCSYEEAAPTAGAASCHGKSYLGCFRDEQIRVLPGDRLLTDPDMTISYCIQFCKKSTTANYTYAGVENGEECYCGEASDDYTRYGVGTDSNCQAPCSGDPTDSCGGVGHIAVFTIHVETSETTPAVVSTAKVDEVTIQPSSEMTSHTRDDVTSSMTTLLSTPTTLQQSGNCSCVGVAVGEGIVIILLIATIIVLVIYILRIRKQQDSNHGQTTHDMTLVKASSSPDKDTGFYHDIHDIRTPAPSSPPAGGSPYSSKIFHKKHGHTTDPAGTGLPTESTHYSTRIKKN